MNTVVLYFIGTQYTNTSPIFNVRGNVYQPKGLGSAVEVREVDAKDLVTKAITYGGNGRAYQGFTRDPNLAAVVKQSQKPIPVDATLAEQAQAVTAVQGKDALLESLSGAGITNDDIMAYLSSKGMTLPEVAKEEPKKSTRRSKAKATDVDTSENEKEG